MTSIGTLTDIVTTLCSKMDKGDQNKDQAPIVFYLL